MINITINRVGPNAEFGSRKVVSDQVNSKSLSTREDNPAWQEEMVIALRTNNWGTIRKLVQVNGVNLDCDLPAGDGNAVRHTPLTWAASNGNTSLLKKLLNEGANPHAMTSEGVAPIHFCSMRSSTLPFLKYLLAHPKVQADVNCRDHRDGATPLMYACANGTLETVTYLLEHNATVNQEDNGGKTALFYAVKGGHCQVIQVLISKYQACANFRDNQNANILYHLIISHKNFPATCLMKIMTYIVEEGGLGVSQPLRDGTTALHEACKAGLIEVVNFLISKQANIEAKRNGWETPLWSLVMVNEPYSNRREMVMFMLEKGANFEVRHCLGMSMLEYAKRVSEDDDLIDSLESALRILKMRRMKALSEKRRAILGYAGINNKAATSWSGLNIPKRAVPVAPKPTEKDLPFEIHFKKRNNSEVTTKDLSADEITSSSSSSSGSSSSSSSGSSSSLSSSSSTTSTSSSSDSSSGSDDDDDCVILGEHRALPVPVFESDPCLAGAGSAPLSSSSSEDEEKFILSNVNIVNRKKWEKFYKQQSQNAKENSKTLPEKITENSAETNSSISSDSSSDEEGNGNGLDFNCNFYASTPAFPGSVSNKKLKRSHYDACEDDEAEPTSDAHTSHVPQKIKHVRRMPVDISDSDSE